ncbi:MAG: hypothetical protein E7222_13550 [Clostridiales bacterium]|nr:hypothetical protein [Clostridiales bacterium]
MKIALLTQREETDKYGAPIDIMESAYIRFFSDLGFLTIPISNYSNNIKELMDLSEVQLLVLTGGGSLSDKFYNEDYKYPEQARREQIERELLERAFKKEISVLAICRGMQYINGYFGGRISRLNHLKIKRINGEEHLVKNIKSGEIFGVNNYHNDGIYLEDLAQLAEPLCIDEDNNVVEAFNILDRKILAIQWHPERHFETEESREITLCLIKEFLEKTY